MSSVIMMTGEGLVLLILIFTFFTGVCPQRSTQTDVKAGEMVALFCHKSRGEKNADVKVTWTSHTTEGMKEMTSNMSSAEQRRMGVLLHGRSLVILSASVNHQGNYSCSLGNDRRLSWFRLTIYTTHTLNTYSATCYTREACELHCPSANVPAPNIPNVTSIGIAWHKEGKSSPSYFSSAKETNSGDYTCTWSYLCHGQIYNRSFTLVLDIQPNEPEKSAAIVSPKNNDVFHVDLGSTVVIDCKAEIYSAFDEIFWLSNNSFVERNNSLPVFYNSTREYVDDKLKMTASLVFPKVSKEDLLKNYTCKLESVSAPPIVVTVSMAEKDGRSYDAFLMDGKSDTDKAVNEDERKLMEKVLITYKGSSSSCFQLHNHLHTAHSRNQPLASDS